MEEQVDRLVKKVWEKLQRIDPNERLLIAVSGIPGSGKTTLAETIVLRLNSTQRTLYGKTVAPPLAAFIPMDGFHLTRAQLSAMPDPAYAHARRGSAFTFDGTSYLALIRLVRQPITPSSKPILAPSFDHTIKDPVENDIAIEPSTRIVVFEGNYLSLDKEPWNMAARLMDERWFLEVDFDTARRRLVQRHVKVGIAKDEVEAEKRVRENDLVNGEEIVRDRMEVDEVLVSRYDDGWKT